MAVKTLFYSGIFLRSKKSLLNVDSWFDIPYVHHYKPLLIRNRSWILTINKALKNVFGLQNVGKKYVYKTRVMMAPIRYVDIFCYKIWFLKRFIGWHRYYQTSNVKSNERLCHIFLTFSEYINLHTTYTVLQKYTQFCLFMM